MAARRPAATLTGAFSIALAMLLTGCKGGGPAGGENVGEAQSALFANGGFEVGAQGAAPPSWTVTTNINPGITIQTPQTFAGLNLAGGGVPLTYIERTAAGPLTQTDAFLGAAASLRWPRFGNGCALVNNGGNNQNVNDLSQTMTIGAGDVDPADGQVHVRFAVAPVLENPGHPNNEQPYFYIQATNVTQGGALLYSNFNFSNQAGVPWKSITTTTTTYDYTDWQLVDISPGSPAINMGDQIELQLIASGCSLGGHMGQLYVDGVGPTVPGLFVSGKGPSQANACSNITYTLTYENGGASADAGVVVTFNTPPQTTFQAVTAPGLTCTTPAVGAAGAVVCTVGNLAAGGSGSFTVTVNIACGATGLVTEGNYYVSGTAVPPLLGPVINTIVGCTADNQCAATLWCDEAAKTCNPKLSNGTPVPSDPPHTNPTLNGTCSPAAGTLTCTSGVCDTKDNECGYVNGDGPCTAANGGTVCRSGVCDTDGKCGYANGDGPCTAANGGTVCRSTACSANGECEPLGGCNVDADCSGGNWCAESTHTCTPKEANGTPVPTDPPHSSPTLNGTCTAAAGTLTCVSSVCDATDNKCGYANGDGPCTVASGPTVCRSTACSQNGLCEPKGGCNVDADCSGGLWCDESTHTCTAKLPNGQSIPNDPPHTGPTLNGTCSSGAATLTCASGVCDTDNKCGYLNGDGPCTVANGGTVCRSGVCDPDGKCGYANGDGPCSGANGPTVCRSMQCSVSGVCEPQGGCEADADCAAGNWCDESAQTCTPKLPNGQPVPKDPPHTNPTLTGTCSQAAGALTCASGVCDTNDNECGYANGDGPCTPANGPTVCRSGACSASGTCEPQGGCNVDADCAGGSWCNESAHTCTPQLGNGSPVPSDPPHMSPTLNGTCTPAAGKLTCVSGVCDTNDNECGYANGDGPCTAANGGTVCRSGACSTNGTCEPQGGCNVDADCTTGNWCNESTHVCTPQLPNGQPVPTDGSHTNPPLDGTCTTAAGTLTCQSGVCDTKDNECGYANGDGPCTAGNGGTVCRSGTCSTNGTCEPSGGCNVDADCPMGKWCNESMGACLPTLPNGTAVPSDPPHTNPTLNGMCSMASGALVCTSAVCDTKDNECGYANGDGPCTPTNGGTVCRSQKCGTTGPSTGVCVGCTMNADCSGATPVCNTMTGICVQCLTSTQCSGATPVCSTSDACVACNGDNASVSTEPCPTPGQPFCFLSGPMAGECGKCTTNTDCQGHVGNVCNTTSGICVTGCFVDTDCATGDWCNAVAPNAGTCVPKLPNGAMLPSMPTSVSMCTSAVGARVCVSGVCDPKDNACGLADGDGTCTSDMQCRDDMCDTASMTCKSPSCTPTSCPSGDFCNTTNGMCTPQQPDGSACSANDQCQTNACTQGVCGGPVIGSGNGLLCSARPEGGAGDGFAALGLLVAAAGLARRRRR